MKIGPRYKIARRLGAHVFEKTQTEKFALSESRRTIKQRKHPKSVTDFALQLLEKQRVRFSYGIGEQQFRRYVREAGKQKIQPPSDALFRSLEMRLDNVIYRLGIAPTRRAARQMVSHGHFLVNGVRTTVPSYAVQKGSSITIREGSSTSPLFENLSERLQDRPVPAWLSFDSGTKTASASDFPVRDLASSPFDLVSVIEFYSR